MTERRWLFLIAALVLCLQIAAFHHVRFDDAYITFRYGANLARGAGFVFNPGQHTMGSTSPGESILAAVVFALVGRDALPSVMASLGCVGWTLQSVMLFQIVRPALGLAGASMTAAAIALGAAGAAPWTPLETNLAMGLTLLAMHLGFSARWLASAAACAAATFMRADACLAAIPLFVLCARETRWSAWKPAALFVALLLPWIVFATRYFGTPIPQSAIRKVNHTPLLTFLDHAAMYLPLPYEPEPASRFALPLWALAIGGAIVLAKRDRRLLVLVVYGALHLAAYAILRTDIAFQWHLYPAVVVFVALEIAMLTSMEDGRPHVLPRSLRGSLEGSARIAGLAAAIAALGYGTWWTASFAIEADSRFWFGRRDALYRQIAKYISEHADEGDIVSAEEVGTVGYYTGLKMNDHAGLVTRDPMRVYRLFLAGQPTKLRWIVLNDKQLEPLHVVYGNRALHAFEVLGTHLWLADLRDPNPP